MLGMYQRYFPILFFAKVATVLPYVDHYNYEHMNFFFSVWLFSVRIRWNYYFWGSSNFLTLRITLPVAVAPFLCTDGFDVCISGI